MSQAKVDRYKEEKAKENSDGGKICRRGPYKSILVLMKNDGGIIIDFSPLITLCCMGNSELNETDAQLHCDRTR